MVYLTCCIDHIAVASSHRPQLVKQSHSAVLQNDLASRENNLAAQTHTHMVSNGGQVMRFILRGARLVDATTDLPTGDMIVEDGILKRLPRASAQTLSPMKYSTSKA